MKINTENLPEKDQKYVHILGINILSTTESQLLAAIEKKISDSHKLGSRSSKFSILTLNPEIILLSQNDKELKNALNSADFAVPDGVGLNFASKFLYGKSLNIVPGRILFEKLIELANKNGWKVFFLGGNDSEAQTAAQKLKIQNKELKIETAGGSEITPTLHKGIVDRINKFSPDLLFVAFGNPKQEIFVAENAKSQMLNVKCFMSVGGTFRYIAGLSPLPPKWMPDLGLEWLWRLFTEPYRLGRIWNAVVVFPLKVFWHKLNRNE